MIYLIKYWIKIFYLPFFNYNCDVNAFEVAVKCI